METTGTTTTAAAPPSLAAPAEEPTLEQPQPPLLQLPPQCHEPPPAAGADAVACCQVAPRRFTPDGKVTSVDLTPDGAYVIAGCSDGTIRLYSMAADSGWGCEGAILGQIHAKGLITNLIFHVEVTDDGRFAFAGVLRGSVEMFAYDLTRLPQGQWAADGTPIPLPRRLSRAQAEGLIECHTNLDPKLRGFGAVARMTNEGTTTTTSTITAEGGGGLFPEYRLICGLGIKNLHIWRFQERAAEEPVWECVYDLVSSGMSIELLALRPGGMEAVSKACGQNLRVWNLAKATDATKCPYVDVLNTHDTRAVFGSFAFGGDAQLSLVRLDLCRQLNRMELALPSTAAMAASGPGAGRSKRRALCSVKSVVGTHGGSGGQDGPVLVVCSDGGVHCYEGGGAASSSATGRLVPVHTLTVEEDDDVDFTLASVGAARTAVVMQTRWSAGKNRGEIVVAPLRLGQGREEAAGLRRTVLGELRGEVLPAGRRSTGGTGAKGTSTDADATHDKENAGPPEQERNEAAPAGGKGKGGGGKRRAKSSPGLLLVPPPLLLSDDNNGSGSAPGGGSHSAPPTASPREGKPAPRSASASKAAAIRAAAAAAAACEALPDGPVPCRQAALRRGGAGLLGSRLLPRGQEQEPYNPRKRKHFDPFAAALSAKSSYLAGLTGATGGSSKRGKPSYMAIHGPATSSGGGDVMPRAMRDVEARRVMEDGAGKTAEFFKERVARQEVLRGLRAEMERMRERTQAAEAEEAVRVPIAESEVRTWAELRSKHERERAALAHKFRQEHDWVRERFLEAVERERLTFHVNKHALPSQVCDPIGFLWWHSARQPLKKQWGRYRSFPQQTAEVLALQGLPDVGARRFSLTSVLSNYKDLAARTVKRQQAEADALAALQGMALPFAHARPLKVEYPYGEDWKVHDPVGAAVAAARRQQEEEATEAVVEEEGEEEEVVEQEEEPAEAVKVSVTAADPDEEKEEEEAEETKQPESPTLSETACQQEELRRISFDDSSMGVEEGKTSVSPVPCTTMAAADDQPKGVTLPAFEPEAAADDRGGERKEEGKKEEEAKEAMDVAA